MTLTPEALRQRLLDRASAPYRAAGKFAYHFARGKLGGDPMFLALLQRGLIPDRSRILDLGCGQGLLAAWLLAARQLYDAGEWPAEWRPECRSLEDGRTQLRFHVYSEHMFRRIVRVTDTYPPGGAVFSTEEKWIVSAPGGFVY